MDGQVRIAKLLAGYGEILRISEALADQLEEVIKENAFLKQSLKNLEEEVKKYVGRAPGIPTEGVKLPQQGGGNGSGTEGSKGEPDNARPVKVQKA